MSPSPAVITRIVAASSAFLGSEFKLEPDKYAAAVTSQETLCREHGSAISVNLLPSAPTHIVSKVLVLDADIVYCILTGVSAQHAKILIQYT